MMLCDFCKSAADHPSSYVPSQAKVRHCNHNNGCACGNMIGAVEALFDADRVDIEWVRIRRTTIYSSPEPMIS